VADDVVLGYDGGDGAKAALAAALPLAKDLGATLVLVFGYEPAHIAGEIQDHRAAVKEFGQRATDEARKQAEAEGVRVEVNLTDEGAVESLLAVAKERSARMIVVGYHGEGPLKGAILGSTPYKLLHVAEHPVLVVRA
jgi:nucleotide-binding universal stress UspA family protein